MSERFTGCPQLQCQGITPMALHAGYVAHKTRNEEACAASIAGHNEYVRLNRIRKQEARDRAAQLEEDLTK